MPKKSYEDASFIKMNKINGLIIFELQILTYKL